MDFSILYAIQTLRGPVMDALILGLTNIMSSYGQIWLVLGVALAVLTVWALNRLCDWLAARRAAQNGGGNPQA